MACILQTAVSIALSRGMADSPGEVVASANDVACGGACHHRGEAIASVDGGNVGGGACDSVRQGVAP